VLSNNRSLILQPLRCTIFLEHNIAVSYTVPAFLPQCGSWKIAERCEHQYPLLCLIIWKKFSFLNPRESQMNI